jgi:hypothetical protein
MFELGQMPQMPQSSPSLISLISSGRVAADTISGSYKLIPQKYYHPNTGRNALGLVGGAEVSMITGSLVDLESDLRNITRDVSRAPAKKYAPLCLLGSSGDEPAPANSLATVNGGVCSDWPKQLNFIERGTNRAISVNTAPRHLPTVQMFSYPGVPAPAPLTQDVYGSPWRF